MSQESSNFDDLLLYKYKPCSTIFMAKSVEKYSNFGVEIEKSSEVSVMSNSFLNIEMSLIPLFDGTFENLIKNM